MKFRFNCAVVLALLSTVACKYEIELLSFETMPELTDSDVMDPGTLRLKQERRNTFVFTGTATLKTNLGKSDKLKVEYFQKLLTGNFIPLFSVMMPFCELLNSSYYPKMAEQSNLPPAGICPFPRGNYTFRSLVIDESFFPSVLPVGENYVVSTIYINDKPVFGNKLGTIIKRLH